MTQCETKRFFKEQVMESCGLNLIIEILPQISRVILNSYLKARPSSITIAMSNFLSRYIKLFTTDEIKDIKNIKKEKKKKHLYSLGLEFPCRNGSN